MGLAILAVRAVAGQLGSIGDVNADGITPRRWVKEALAVSVCMSVFSIYFSIVGIMLELPNPVRIIVVVAASLLCTYGVQQYAQRTVSRPGR